MTLATCAKFAFDNSEPFESYGLGGVVFMGHPVFIAYFKNCNVILKRQNSTVLYSEFRTETVDKH